MIRLKEVKPELHLDENLSNLIKKGVESLFETSFQSKVIAGSTMFSNDFSGIADISGQIGMIQENLEGTLTVGFPKDVILSLVGKTYGKKISEIDKSVRQAVAEITNIIYGLLKKNLNEVGFTFQSSIPQVVVGQSHEFYHLHSGKSMILPFTLDSGKFIVFVTLQNY